MEDKQGMTDDHRGLATDLKRLLEGKIRRRNFLRLLAGASVLPLVPLGACGSDDAATTDPGDGSCPSLIPEETAGPYPGDGSNSSGGSVANALALSGIVRSDIRASVAGATGVAEGIPLTVKLKIADKNAGCAGLAGYVVYLWHCDRAGQYSMYSAAVKDENYLRGVQEADADGYVTFQTIFPGCYDGRMPHMHFEVYPSIVDATSYQNKLNTSQLAFPEDVCDDVYATAGYEDSAENFAQISFSQDNVFSDGTAQQLTTVTGNVSDGYIATLVVAI